MLKITATIDRLYGSTAIIEQEESNGKVVFISVPREELPEDAKAGDKIFKENGEWFIDQEKTETERKRIRGLMDSLFEKRGE